MAGTVTTPVGAPGAHVVDAGLHRLLVDSVQDYAIFALDPDGRVLTWNTGAQRVKGYMPEEIIGRSFAVFYRPEDRAAGKPEWELATAARDGRVEDDGWRVRKDGSMFWANVVITVLRDDAGTLVGFAKITRDVTERRQAEEALRERATEDRHQAMHDPLTGLANRTLFAEQVLHALARADRAGTMLAVLFIDLDGFKQVNDTVGHAAGDRVLVEAADRLLGVVRAGDTVARLGGDEFAILLEGTHAELATAEALDVATRLTAALRVPMDVAGQLHTLQASVGVTVGDAASPAALLAQADRAMYAAKARGDGHPVLFVPGM